MPKKYTILGNALQSTGGGFSSGTGAADEKVKITAADTTPNFLDSKLSVTGGNISKAVINPGANEGLQLNSLDEKIKASAADTTPNDLNNKLTVSGELAKTIVNPGADEKINIDGAPIAGKHFTLIYNNYSSGLVTGTMLHPPEYNRPPGSPSAGGYYTNSGFEIQTIAILLHRFASTGGDSIYIRLREGGGDGTWNFPFSPGDGSIVGTVFYNVPNTAGATKYYFGGYDDLNWTVSSGEALFCYIQSSNINTLDGITLWLHCYDV